jgi:hypothetical protein
MQPSIPLESVSLFGQNPMMQKTQPKKQPEQQNSLTSLVKERLQSKEEERDALQVRSTHPALRRGIFFPYFLPSPCC